MLIPDAITPAVIDGAEQSASECKEIAVPELMEKLVLDEAAVGKTTT